MTTIRKNIVIDRIRMGMLRSLRSGKRKVSSWRYHDFWHMKGGSMDICAMFCSCCHFACSLSCWNRGWERWGQWGGHLQQAVRTVGWIVDATGGDGLCTRLRICMLDFSHFHVGHCTKGCPREHIFIMNIGYEQARLVYLNSHFAQTPTDRGTQGPQLLTI